jgi:hypothetical protein
VTVDSSRPIAEIWSDWNERAVDFMVGAIAGLIALIVEIIEAARNALGRGPDFRDNASWR